MRIRLPSIRRPRLLAVELFGIRVTMLAVLMTFFAIGFGVLLDQLVREGPVMTADSAAANHLHGWVRAVPGLTFLLGLLGLPGHPVVLGLVAAAGIGFLFWRGRARLALFVAITSVMGAVMGGLVRAGVDRERPSLSAPLPTSTGGSFPSGRVMMATIVLGALLLAFAPAIPKRLKDKAIRAYVYTLLAVGFSRLSLGVHYISDVLSAYLLGAVWLGSCTSAFRSWRVQRGRRPAPLERGLEPEAAGDLKPPDVLPEPLRHRVAGRWGGDAPTPARKAS